MLSESAAGEELLKNPLPCMTRMRMSSSKMENEFLKSKNGDIDNVSNYSRNYILLNWMCNGRFYQQEVEVMLFPAIVVAIFCYWVYCMICK